MSYEQTVVSDPVDTLVYDGDVTVRNDVRADFLIRQKTRTTITTTVTTHDDETDEQIGDPVVTEAYTDAYTGARERFPFDIRDIEDAQVRNPRLAELAVRIQVWIDSIVVDETVETYLQARLDEFLATL